jgi:N-acetylglucosamine-6-phosphate deacetylase
MRVGVRDAIVAGRRVPGDVVVEAGKIAEVGALPPGSSGLAAPGFVDLQVNGFGGVDFLGAAPEDYSIAGSALAATGVTAYQPTFISSPMAAYGPALRVATAALEVRTGPRLLGVHLEGPFLSPERTGAHNPANLLEPDLELADRLCEGGPVTYMTVAPELAGALELISHLVDRGVVVACGHSEADAAQAHAAFDAGARAVTHIYNAQRRWSARDPGIAGVSLVRPDVIVQAIVDGVHLAPETAYATFLATRHRFAMVTDSISAAGLPDGHYRLGDQEVEVADGEARTKGGALAGSVSTMDASLRLLVSLGAPLEEALASASRIPALLIGRRDLGVLTSGAPADIVVLDSDLGVERTLVAGHEVYAREH